jgi:tripartite-type tricarboxylate transporter receptor subunit TctC
MSSAGILTANPHLYAKMPFDAATAFIPVSNVAQMNMVLVVHPKVPAQNLKEFIALAKAQPGKLNFGSPGIGTTGPSRPRHADARRADPAHSTCPTKGAAPAVTDLIAGQIDGVVDNPPTVIAHIQGGKLRPLAFAAKRAACRSCRTCRPPAEAGPRQLSRRRHGSASPRRPARRQL